MLTDTNPFEDLSYAEIVAELNRTPSSNYTNCDRVYDFHMATGASINNWPPTQQEINLREDLIFEEFQEVKNELHDLDFVRMKTNIDKRKLAKELADLLYVTYGTAISFGIDIDRVFEEVSNSNMSKLIEGGKTIQRQDGKILKGPNYKEPDLSFVV